jgi:hypothetical protein
MPFREQTRVNPHGSVVELSNLQSQSKNKEGNVVTLIGGKSARQDLAADTWYQHQTVFFGEYVFIFYG